MLFKAFGTFVKNFWAICYAKYMQSAVTSPYFRLKFPEKKTNKSKKIFQETWLQKYKI